MVLYKSYLCADYNFNTNVTVAVSNTTCRDEWMFWKTKNKKQIDYNGKVWRRQDGTTLDIKSKKRQTNKNLDFQILRKFSNCKQKEKKIIKMRW